MYGIHENLVYGCEMDTIDELLQRIYDASGYVNDAAVLLTGVL
jgi:hypothetical protein